MREPEEDAERSEEAPPSAPYSLRSARRNPTTQFRTRERAEEQSQDEAAQSSEDDLSPVKTRSKSTNKNSYGQTPLQRGNILGIPDDAELCRPAIRSSRTETELSEEEDMNESTSETSFPTTNRYRSVRDETEPGVQAHMPKEDPQTAPKKSSLQSGGGHSFVWILADC